MTYNVNCKYEEKYCRILGIIYLKPFFRKLQSLTNCFAI